MASLNHLIQTAREAQPFLRDQKLEHSSALVGSAARRLEECRAFFERFAAGEPPPENTTYEQWARELLA